MPIIPMLLTIAIAGFIVWVILQIPMPQPFPRIIIAVVCLIVVLWLLQMFGVETGMPWIRAR